MCNRKELGARAGFLPVCNCGIYLADLVSQNQAKTVPCFLQGYGYLCRGCSNVRGNLQPRLPVLETVVHFGPTPPQDSRADHASPIQVEGAPQINARQPVLTATAHSYKTLPLLLLAPPLSHRRSNHDKCFWHFVCLLLRERFKPRAMLALARLRRQSITWSSIFSLGDTLS